VGVVGAAAPATWLFSAALSERWFSHTSVFNFPIFSDRRDRGGRIRYHGVRSRVIVQAAVFTLWVSLIVHSPRPLWSDLPPGGLINLVRRDGAAQLMYLAVSCLVAAGDLLLCFGIWITCDGQNAAGSCAT